MSYLLRAGRPLLTLGAIFTGADKMPSIFGLELNQAYGAVFFIVLVVSANWLERPSLKAIDD